MKNNYKKIISSLGLILISNLANAESLIYKMVDKNGRIVYSDRLPSNEKGTYAILSPKSGILKATVSRELNKEEIMENDAKKQEEKSIIEKSEMQKRKDNALLSTYSNVAEIDKIKNFEMNQIDQSIKSSIDIVATIKERMNQVQEGIKSSPGNKKLQEDSSKLATDLETANKTLDYNKDLRIKRESKYNEDKTRYEQILKDMNNNMPTANKN